MARKFKITESQYQMICEMNDNNQVDVGLTQISKIVNKPEGIDPNNSTAIDQAKKEVSAKLNKQVNVTIPESKVITKKQLQENYHKKLKANSKVYTVKDFIKR